MTEPEQHSLEELKQRLREFAEARDWDQSDVHGCSNAPGGRTPGAGHSPKNLSMALIAEAAELVEHLMYTDVRMPWAQDAQERPNG